jgi:NitT/TauT family transport system substrate-binding protein
MKNVRCVVPGLLAGVSLALCAWQAQAVEKVRFGLNWLPQAEMCGFYQAQAEGLYRKAGLEVELVAGGPDRNIPLQVATGDLDLGMGSGFTTLNMINQHIPARTVAAFLQKDPQTLVAHADQGVKTLADLKGKPIMVAKFSQSEFWQFLKQKYGFSDSQLRPYTYSAAPFLANPQAVQQGYITEDALLLGRALPKAPVSILLADYGYQNYATTVFATQKYLDAHDKAVAAFVDASRQGWDECAHGDYSPAMQAILAANPEHGEELFHFKMKQMRDLGLVDSGDAVEHGVGAMSDARWKAFFETMAAAGVYPASLDYRQAYTLRYVDQGSGALAAKEP